MTKKKTAKKTSKKKARARRVYKFNTIEEAIEDIKAGNGWV